MRGFLIFLGFLLVVGGGGVAGVQFANLDLSVLDAAPAAKTFLLSPMALYAGGGAAAFGLLLMIIAAATGGKKADKPAKASARPEQTKKPARPERPRTADKVVDAEPAPQVPRTGIRPPEKPSPAPKTAVAPSDQPPWSQPASAAGKPTASAHPPEDHDVLTASRSDPRLLNRKRVTDLVSINDALKAYHAQHAAYPKAEGLLGFAERGEAWIPKLAPDFIARLPRDPATAGGQAGSQYVYASDGRNYKLLAQGVSLIGGTNVEVLGVRIDPTRQPTADNAAFGFWTPEFASA